MTYQQVYDVVAGIRVNGKLLPCAYYQYSTDDPQNPPPPPPYLCYYYEGSDDFEADNCNYQRIRPLTLELYTDTKDFAAEQAVEDALAAAGLVYDRTETYIQSERMYMVVYTTDIIITEE